MHTRTRVEDDGLLAAQGAGVDVVCMGNYVTIGYTSGRRGMQDKALRPRAGSGSHEGIKEGNSGYKCDLKRTEGSDEQEITG